MTYMSSCLTPGLLGINFFIFKQISFPGFQLIIENSAGPKMLVSSKVDKSYRITKFQPDLCLFASYALNWM